MAVLRDLNSLVTAAPAAGGRLTAGGTGDNTKVTGASIDTAPPGLQKYMGAVLVITGTSTVQAANTLKFAVEQEESDDNSSWVNTTTIQATKTAVTGATTAAAFVQTLAINLAPLKRYVRFNPTPDISTANTDTAEWGATLVMAGESIPTP